MPSKDHFRNLAQMSRRIARNMTDRAIAERLEAIGDEFEQQAKDTPDSDPLDGLVPTKEAGQGKDERA
jgi:hypothetical protein